MAHLLNVLFLPNDILNGPCPKQLQPKKKKPAQHFGTQKKKKNRGVQQRAPTQTDPRPRSFRQQPGPALVQKDRLSLSFPW